MADDLDAELGRLVSTGDLSGALRLLMTRHGDAVYRYVSKELRGSSRADDVHQRVFMDAFRDLPKFRGGSSYRTWLFAIARHRIIDEIRQGTREESRRAGGRRAADDDEAGGGDPVAEVADPAPSAPERIDDARLLAALTQCLEGLGEHVRTAVLLRFQQSFSYEEMAEICDEKSGTLQARVSRALPALRKCIEHATGGEV